MTTNRYQNDLTVVTGSSGQQIYQTNLVRDIAVDTTDPVITVDGETRLDNLAAKYYGDAQLWWVIAKANNIVNGSIFTPIGMQLVIPNKNKIV